jgi:hypothetical protein
MEFVSSKELYPAFVGGYGSGKTEGGIWRILTLKFASPFQDVGFYLPTYDLINLIAIPRICEILERMKIPYNLHKQEKRVEIKSCSSIILRNMDRPERIVGYEVCDSIIDELDILPIDKAEDVWRKVVARNRQKKTNGEPNTIGVTTTPVGFKFTYKNWKKEPLQGARLINASTYSNEKNLPSGYIESLKNSYPQQMLSAYLNGEFVNLTQGCVYHDFDRDLNRSSCTHENNEPVHIGMDFNVGKMAASVHIIRENNPHAIDEFEGYLDTPAIIEAIRSRYWRNGRTCSIMVYPDASGASRSSVNASESDLALLRQAGFTVLANNRNPFIKDRVAAMNKMICCNGIRRYFVNIDRCPHLVETLEKQSYDKNGVPDKTSGFDHMGDGAGYFIAYTYPIAHNIGSNFKLKGV